MIARRAIVVELSPNVDCDILRALANLAYRYRELEICPEDLPRTACTERVP